MTDAPRCADWARREDVSPLGTAPHAAGWLLVEWPLPWPPDVHEVPGLEPVQAALEGTGIRLQLVVPRPDRRARSVVLYDRPDDGWFRAYRRRTAPAAPADVVEAALGLLAERHGDHRGEEGRDVLVCGHGSRDRCCGSMGTALAIEATAAGAVARRTSHLGGHRFAPTAVLLPEGTTWAFLDGAVLGAVLARTGSPAEVLHHLRGSTALGSPELQAAEAAVLAREGWAWLDRPRRATATGEGRIRVEARDASGAIRSWEVEVHTGRDLPVPVCREPLEAASKTQTEVVPGSPHATSTSSPPARPPTSTAG